jgi:hypothetical protein
MTIGHVGVVKEYRPNPNIRGGSKKGKPHGIWPWIMKIAADAVHECWIGAQDASRRNHRMMSAAKFKKRMDTLLPGWEDHIREHLGPRKKPYIELLMNRVYKGAMYAGTSARGKRHDPKTRANRSKEHWTYKFGPKHKLAKLHDLILRGELVEIERWERYLRFG